MRILTLALCLLASSSCKTTKKTLPNDSSKLKDFAPSSALSEEQAILRFAAKSVYVEKSQAILQTADANLAKARQLTDEYLRSMDKEQKRDIESSDLLDCLLTTSKPGDCAGRASVPRLALPYLQRAILGYFEIVSTFDPPTLIADASDTALDSNSLIIRQRSEIPANIFVAEGLKLNSEGKLDRDFWDITLEKNCGGLMSSLVRSLCDDYLTSYFLHVAASKHLEASFTADPVAASREYNRFRLLYEYAEQKKAIVTNIYGEASLKLSAISSGILDSSGIERTSVLAVVGRPEDFIPKLEEYFGRYREALSKEIDFKVQTEQARVNLILNKDNIKTTLASVEEALKSNELAKLETNYLTKENNFIMERFQKTEKTIKEQKRSFDLNFESIFGQWGNGTQKSGAAISTNVSANGRVTRIEIPPGLARGAIELSASGTIRYRANGIYFNNTPKTELFKVKMSCSACKAAVKTVNNNIYQVVKATSPAPVAQAFKKLQDETNNGLKQIDKNIFQPIGAEIERIPGNAKNLFGIAGLVNMPVRPVRPTYLPNLAGSELDKQIDTLSTVWRQLTDVNGYTIATNFGRSAGVSTGASSGDSTSFSPQFLGGWGSSASRGQSTGSSKGVSYGVSGQIGFMHPRAASSSLRVGMLVARFVECADPALSRLIIPVGTGNVIAIDDATGKCKALEIFINDNLQGAAGVCGDGKPCGGAEQVPVQAQFYIDEKRVFETMMTIFQSDEFQQTLDDAAFSNDPLGSAIRLFENMGLGKGLPPEVLPKFRPVVEHFVTVKLNERDLVRIGLDKEKFELEVDKVKSKQTIIQSQVDTLRDRAQSLTDVASLQGHIIGLLEGREALYSSLSSYYASRIEYWYGIYRSSVLYHNPNAVVPDLFGKIQNVNEGITEGVLEGKSAADVKASMNELAFETLLNDMKEKKFLQGLMTQGALGHCFVSLKDLGLAPGFFDPAKTNGISQWVAADDVRFDKDIADTIKPSSAAVLGGYYRIRMNTDPALFSGYVSSVSPPVGQKAVLRCRQGNLSLDKIIGLAVTYGFVNGETPTKDIHNVLYMSQDSLVYGSKSGQRVWRMIDRSLPSSFWGTSISVDQLPSTPIPLFLESDVFSECRSASGLDNWENAACASKLLGNEISADTVEFKGLLKSFFNSYMGASWNIYIPDQGWDEFRSKIDDVKVHFFFQKRTAKN